MKCLEVYLVTLLSSLAQVYLGFNSDCILQKSQKKQVGEF